MPIPVVVTDLVVVSCNECGATYDKRAHANCPVCAAFEKPRHTPVAAPKTTEIGALRSENAQLRREIAVLREQAEVARLLIQREGDVPGLHRAIYEDWVMEDAERIAEKAENVEHVLGVMWGRGPQNPKDRRYRAAAEMAARVRARLRSRHGR